MMALKALEIRLAVRLVNVLLKKKIRDNNMQTTHCLSRDVNTKIVRL